MEIMVATAIFHQYMEQKFLQLAEVEAPNTATMERMEVLVGVGRQLQRGLSILELQYQTTFQAGCLGITVDLALSVEGLVIFAVPPITVMGVEVAAAQGPWDSMAFGGLM
jgi:hypothetical protein